MKISLRLVFAWAALAALVSIVLVACGGGGGGGGNGSVSANDVIAAMSGARTASAGQDAYNLADRYLRLGATSDTAPVTIHTDFNAYMGKTQALYNNGGVPITFQETFEGLLDTIPGSETAPQLIAALNADIATTPVVPATPIQRVLLLLGIREPGTLLPRPISATETCSPFNVFLISAWLANRGPLDLGIAPTPAIASGEKVAGVLSSAATTTCKDNCQKTFQLAQTNCQKLRTQADIQANNLYITDLKVLMDRATIEFETLTSIIENFRKLAQNAAGNTRTTASEFNALADEAQLKLNAARAALVVDQETSKRAYDAQIVKNQQAQTACVATANVALTRCLSGCHSQGGG